MLAICSPIYRTVEPAFLASLHETLQAGGPDVRFIYTQGHANLARARNYLVREARNSGAEALVFIDSDISWDQDAFGALFDAPDHVRVIAGAPQRREQKLGFCGGVDRDPTLCGKLVAGTAATAFLRIDCSVFDELEPKVPSYRYQGEMFPAFFQVGIRDGEMLDEDVWFSRLCKDNRVGVWIDPTIRLGHWQAQPFTARMSDYVRFEPLKEAVA